MTGLRTYKKRTVSCEKRTILYNNRIVPCEKIVFYRTFVKKNVSYRMKNVQDRMRNVLYRTKRIRTV